MLMWKCDINLKGEFVMFCPNCGTQNADNSNHCSNCGASLNAQQPNYQQAPNQSNPMSGGEAKSKLVAGLLGIFLGGFGIHNFYLGFTTKAIIQIVVSLVTCGLGAWWGIIEGILILVGNIKVDANGTPLND